MFFKLIKHKFIGDCIEMIDIVTGKVVFCCSGAHGTNALQSHVLFFQKYRKLVSLYTILINILVLQRTIIFIKTLQIYELRGPCRCKITGTVLQCHPIKTGLVMCVGHIVLRV